VDSESSDPKVLVERLIEVQPGEATSAADEPYAPGEMGDFAFGVGLPGDEDDAVYVPVPNELRRVAEQITPRPPKPVPSAQSSRPAEMIPASDPGDLLPPEEPPDWGFGEIPSERSERPQPAAQPPARPAPPLAAAENPAPAPLSNPAVERSERSERPAPPPAENTAAREKKTSPVPVEEIVPPLKITPAPFFVSPLLQSAAQESSEPRMVTISLRSTGDRERDVRRIRRAHGVLTSFPGHDRFAFQIFEGARYYQLEFPSNTTGISTPLLQKLVELVGEENVRIEPIRIH